MRLSNTKCIESKAYRGPPRCIPFLVNDGLSVSNCPSGQPFIKFSLALHQIISPLHISWGYWWTLFLEAKKLHIKTNFCVFRQLMHIFPMSKQTVKYLYRFGIRKLIRGSLLKFHFRALVNCLYVLICMCFWWNNFQSVSIFFALKMRSWWLS